MKENFFIKIAKKKAIDSKHFLFILSLKSTIIFWNLKNKIDKNITFII